MSSRISLMVALGLLIGALAAGFWGIRLSQEKAQHDVPQLPAAAVEAAQWVQNAQQQAVVVAVHDLPAMQAITAEHVRLQPVELVPAGSYTRLDQVVGQIPWVSLSAGSWLGPGHFAGGSELASMILPGERAIALAIDDVTAVGGFLKPGDFVDVLAVVQDDQGSRERSALVALPAVRLLSLGEVLGQKLPDQAVAGAPTEGAALPLSMQGRARHVVLAVPEEWAPRLLLASQAGSVRLALRSAQEQLPARYQAGELAPVALEEVAGVRVKVADLAGGNAAAVAAPPPDVPTRSSPPAAAPRGTEVLRAGQRSWQ